MKIFSWSESFLSLHWQLRI